MAWCSVCVSVSARWRRWRSLAQASYYVFNHTWPISKDEAVGLSGRLCVMRFGRHNRRKCVCGSRTGVAGRVCDVCSCVCCCALRWWTATCGARLFCRHVPGTITHSIHTFIPEAVMLALPGLEIREWEVLVFEQHALLRDNISPLVNQQKWLRILNSGTVGAYYGSTLFPATVRRASGCHAAGV